MKSEEQIRQEIIDELIDKPQIKEFIEAVKCEIAHQERRWGDETEAPPHHFQMVISMISGKLVKSILDNDLEKFTHHLITIAAVAGTAHKYLQNNSSKVFKYFNKDENK